MTIARGPWSGSHVDGDLAHEIAALMRRHRVQAFSLAFIRSVDPIDAEFRHDMGDLDGSAVGHCVLASMTRQCARRIEERVLGDDK